MAKKITGGKNTAKANIREQKNNKLKNRGLKQERSVKKVDPVASKNKKPEKDAKKDLKVRFLGGVGEIGKNMTVLEYGKDILVIDAGLTFPGDNMPGVDMVIPDASYLTENRSRVRGIVITHGHEDHIGALPFIIKDLGAPIFGTKLTLTLIENKLKERGIENAKLNCVKAGGSVKLGCFSVEFIGVNHSIAGAVALSITTPLGVVFHSGDFKVDYTPVNDSVIDLPRIAEIGKKGVMLLLCESTNVEIEGSALSESAVRKALDSVFSENAKRRLIIATFASNVHRLQQIIDLAEKYKRKVVFSGRSMINIAESASKIGELFIPDGIVADVERLKYFKDEEVVIISTGTQGEPMSALTRMASGEFNKVVIGGNDTVVLSSSVIPGNEKMIYGVINNLYKLGAEVIYESLEPIHASGHACREDLKLLHTLLKPKFFIPVHGEYRHLKKHADLAKSLGMKESNIMIAEIGDTAVLDGKSIKRGEKFKAGSNLVDGVGIDGADSYVLRDRIHLSEDGLFVIVVGVDEMSAELTSLEIIGKGIAVTDEIINGAKANILNALKNVDMRKVNDESELASIIRRGVKNYLYKQTKKNPMILPVVMVV